VCVCVCDAAVGCVTFIVYFSICHVLYCCVYSFIICREIKLTYCMINAEQEASKKSSAAWLKTVLRSGTVADKTAALVLMIQESPVHNLSSLDSLLAIVKKKGRRREVLQTLGQNISNIHISISPQVVTSSDRTFVM